jgi:hypothetical protein
VFAAFQRGKGLEEFEYLDGHVLIFGDGTGQFLSSNVCCPQCCVKELQNGTKTYYHQMFGACIVHPFPAGIAVESIKNLIMQEV